MKVKVTKVVDGWDGIDFVDADGYSTISFSLMKLSEGYTLSQYGGSSWEFKTKKAALEWVRHEASIRI
jgi:hypothetical protein